MNGVDESMDGGGMYKCVGYCCIEWIDRYIDVWINYVLDRHVV